jgi:hypothetical protein
MDTGATIAGKGFFVKATLLDTSGKRRYTTGDGMKPSFGNPERFS